MNTSARPPALRRRAVSSHAGARASGRGAAGRDGTPWLWLLPALTALLLYGRTLGFAFVWDDLDLVVRNATLHGADWARLLAQDFWQATGGGTGMWRPLVTLSERLDGVLGGWQPWLFHLQNTLALAVSATLVALLARRRTLPRWTAVAAGMAYASAPALSESTAWVAGRSDAYAALFALASLVLARAARRRGSRLLGAASALGVALALAAKESALVLPLLLAADAADDERRGAWRACRAALPSVAVVLVWVIAHHALVPGPQRPATPGAASGMAALVWATLAWLAPWAPHSPLLDLWHAPSPAVAIAAWLGLAGVVVGTVVLVRRRIAHAVVPALLFAPLAPVAAAALAEPGVRFAERGLALPVAGLALALAAIAASLAVRHRAVAAAGLVLWVGSQAAFAWPAIGAWRDEVSRIRRIAEMRPRDTDALLGMADLLSTEGHDEEALVWIERAEAVDPADAGPLVARASLAFRAGRMPQALAAAEAARARAPEDLAAGVIRVRALSRLGRAAEAVRAGTELVATHVGEPAAEGALGTARLAAGDTAGALAALRNASERLLDDAGLAWDLGRAAIAAGDVPLARTAFERAVTAAPGFYEAWLGVADTRARLADTTGADAALARASALAGAGDGRAQALRAHIHPR